MLSRLVWLPRRQVPVLLHLNAELLVPLPQLILLLYGAKVLLTQCICFDDRVLRHWHR